MQDLKYWQNIIQEKRKNTNFHDFLEEIGSWFPIVFHKYNEVLSRHPISERIYWVISSHEFEENRWNLSKKGREYDFSKTFEENFSSLLSSIQISNLVQFENNENAAYGDIVLGSKNIYLSIVAVESENVMYSHTILQSKNVYRSFLVEHGSENIYHSKCISDSQDIFYCKYIQWWYNLWFCSDCIGCKNCILCEDLENKEYCINNIQYSQEQYNQEKRKILKDYYTYLDIYTKLKKFGKNIACTDTTGNFNISCEGVENGFLCRNLKDSRNAINSGTGNGMFENAYDVISTWEFNNSDFYGIMWAWLGSSHLYCSSEITRSNNIFYSYFLASCDHMIGCIWMSNSSYCIFNKQYSKQEWEELASKIFSQMQDEWALGKMISPKNNPFYFNDTFAGIVWDFSREEILKKGYLWRDDPIKTWVPEWSTIVQSKDLDIKNFEKDICDVVIESDEGNFYRIMPLEYEFLKKHNLPLPNIHWKDTMKMQMEQ